MDQRTTILVTLVLVYEDDAMTEYAAQDKAIQSISVQGVEMEHAEIVAGLVDSDGIPVQPSVREVLASQHRPFTNSWGLTF